MEKQINITEINSQAVNLWKYNKQDQKLSSVIDEFIEIYTSKGFTIVY